MLAERELTQEAFALLSQILEFWEGSFLSPHNAGKIPPEQVSIPESVINDQKANVGQSKVVADPNESNTVRYDKVEPAVPNDQGDQGAITPNNLHNGDISPSSDNAKLTDSMEDIAFKKNENEPIAKPVGEKNADTIESHTPTQQLEVAPNAVKPATESQESVQESLAKDNNFTFLPVPSYYTKTDINSETYIGMKRGLVYGRQFNPKLKQDGDWNFYTFVRSKNINDQCVLFETVFSMPFQTNPVPAGTASVWFKMTLKGNTWETKIRYEHHHQEHCVMFDADVARNGKALKEKMVVFNQKYKLANPTKRLQEIISSKSNVYDFSIKSQ